MKITQSDRMGEASWHFIRSDGDDNNLYREISSDAKDDFNLCQYDIYNIIYSQYNMYNIIYSQNSIRPAYEIMRLRLGADQQNYIFLYPPITSPPEMEQSNLDQNTKATFLEDTLFL